MIVLGIDPGLHTGWAAMWEDDEEGQIICGTWNLRDDPSEHSLYALYSYLNTLIGMTQPDLVCYEEPVARGMAARSLNRQIGVIITVCEIAEIAHYPVNPGTLKKFATGKGNASKEEMKEALDIRGLGEEMDHNAVDAIWLADYGMSEVAPQLEVGDAEGD